MTPPGPTPLDWTALLRGALPAEGAQVTIVGEAGPATDRGLVLVPEAGCCGQDRPDPALAIDVALAGVAPSRRGALRVEGTWRSLPANDPSGWCWRLDEARALPLSPFSRRALLAAPLVCAAPRLAAAQPGADARAVLEAARATDLHSHAGRVILRRGPDQRPFTPIAAPMRQGGMTLIALAMVADTPMTEVIDGRRITAVRDPAPGQLWDHGLAAFARLHALVAQEGLAVVTDQAGLARSRQPGAPPAVMVAAEGADFLEGRIERVETLFRDQRLRHLQLTHYRVNALGDIQTAAPVHGGLTDVGAAVIRACNRLGIVVDIAHGTEALVRRAAEVTTKPLLLSHTALSPRPRPRSRLIGPGHARLVAATGGVIGVWPLVGPAPSAALYAESIARMVDVAGVDHVGLGSDMRGLLSPGAFETYRETPGIAAALLATGFSQAEAMQILGGNHARVLAAVLPQTTEPR